VRITAISLLHMCLLVGLPASGGAQAPRTTPWIDPAWTTSTSQPGQAARALIWFDRQLLANGEQYAERAAQHRNDRRSDMRRQTVHALKELSDTSWLAARDTLAALEQRGIIGHCVRSWIVNAITCDLPQGDPAALGSIPGVARVYRVPTRTPAPSAAVATATSRAPTGPPFVPDASEADWNARMLGVDRVWREYGLTGAGVLQVVHDFGWTFGPETIRATLWHNPGEVADDGIDNDGNGRIDDVHGFNFDRGDAELGVPTGGLPGGLTHGDLTAAMLAGREAADTGVLLGMAPGSRWAAVISTSSIAPAVEWAIEQDVHTYSMSFSIPNLGEMRGVWRKVMEHGALAGLFFVSGAGNFADSTRPNFVPTPAQMRIPEDIPHAVLGVAGVGRDGTRPVFSSQGPVEWRTVEYTEGLVPKPDLATLNTNLLGIDSLGNAFVPGPRGWSGNSFAGPHLAGVLALMIEADPELTPWRAREILMETARDIGAPGFDHQSGAGLVDAFRAVTVVREWAERRSR
jgi:subtilisin family serine protease